MIFSGIIINDDNPEEDDSSSMYSEETVPRIFERDNELYKLLTKEGNGLPQGYYCFSLYVVNNAVQRYIYTKALYDMSNSSIVISNHELEKALGPKTFHLSILNDLIIKNMKLDPKVSKFYTVDNTSTEKMPIDAPFTRRDLFWIKPHLRKITDKAKSNRTKNRFNTYENICSYVADYLMENNANLLGPKHHGTCFIEGTELETAFKCKAFHRSQLHNKIKGQIKRLKPYYIKHRPRQLNNN